MQNVPVYLNLLFILTTALAVWIFFKAAKNSGLFLVIMLAWLILQGVLGYLGFYTITSTMPPRFVLLLGPAILFIIILFLLPTGQKWVDSLDLKMLTWLHVVRIPVEITLYLLFTFKTIPELMTFGGSNPDILSGLTAPIVAILLFRKGKIRKFGLLIWNIACLMLLANIVFRAIFSAPFPFQQFAFEQPNIAILYFPYVWLPCCVVPLVLLSHLASIRQLMKLK